MWLTTLDVQQTLEKAQAAFPHLTDWQYANAADGEHDDFTLWGRWSMADDDPLLVRNFFITFETYQDTWCGHLTVGQHAYLWTSADFGDAYLVDTAPCPTFDEAVAVLKRNIAQFCRVWIA